MATGPRFASGAGEIGFYFIEDGVLQMCNEHGRPTGAHHKLWSDDKPEGIARRFARDAWRKRTKESSFNRPLNYQHWGVA